LMHRANFGFSAKISETSKLESSLEMLLTLIMSYIEKAGEQHT
jgi:hypothetical protein